MAVSSRTIPPMPTQIALLHGFTQTGQSWDPVRTRLLASPAMRTDLEIIAPDLAGHGSQSHRPLTLPVAAAEFAEQVGPSHLVGYSMGGRLALHIATAEPLAVRSLVLISSTAGIDDPAERADRRTADRVLAERIEQIGVESFVEWWLSQPMFATLTEESSDYRLDNTAAGLAGSLRLAGTGAHEPLWDALGDLRVPTLIITGALDTKFTALGERMAASIDHARHIIVAGSGHAVHLERPEVVAEHLADWFAEVDPAGSGG